jgi:hypothetical protein
MAAPVKRGPGRPRLGLADAQEAAAARGGVCLSAACAGSQARLRWRCGADHEWAATLNSVRNVGTWCPRCAPRGRPRLSLAEAQALAGARGGRCLSPPEDCAATARLRWQCEAGHEWAALYSSVCYLKTWCPHCRSSGPEQIARALLTRALGPPSPVRRPPFTWTAASPRGLELDLFYPQFGFAVEVQGEQHRRWVPHFQPDEAAFEAQCRRDELKRELCFANWIVLVELWPEDDAEWALRAFVEDLGLAWGAA